MLLHGNKALKIFSKVDLHILEDRPQSRVKGRISSPSPDRAVTAHACTKTHTFESPQFPATDLKIRQHLIFSSLGLKPFIYHFKKLICPNISLAQIGR